MTELSAEDNKLVTLARATRARAGAAEGAAVRDADGRTYAAATVDLPSLQLSALGVCVAMAVAVGRAGPGGRGACSPRPRTVAPPTSTRCATSAAPGSSCTSATRAGRCRATRHLSRHLGHSRAGTAAPVPRAVLRVRCGA